MSARKLSRKGLALPGHKDVSLRRPLSDLPAPDQVRIHFHPQQRLLVACGDDVLIGTPLAEESLRHARVLASVSGQVSLINTERHYLLVDNDQRAQRQPFTAYADTFSTRPRSELLDAIRACGLCGLGGAGFTSHRKLAQTDIHTLVVNAAECEPYISADQALLQTRAAAILEGIDVATYLLQPKQVFIALEHHCDASVSALQNALAQHKHNNIELVELPKRYPSGAEHYVIEAATGTALPTTCAPHTQGIICHNVATIVALADAICRGQPLVSRIVTISGDVPTPRNLLARFGTPISQLLAAAGVSQPSLDHAHELIIGGPLMGRQAQLDEGLSFDANCLILRPKPKTQPMPCIRCGDCADVCPESLLPQELWRHWQAGQLPQAADLRLDHCIACGCCDYVCPSHIALATGFRQAQAAWHSQQQARARAEHARQRFLARNTRLEAAEAARIARIAAKKAALNRRRKP